MPPGTPRYWSWLFATAESRPPLLGIYALVAEWRALMDPSTETSVAHIKLAWWREEMHRLAAGAAVHPISTYLAALPRAAVVDFSPLVAAVEAAANQVGGAPLERAADLAPHAEALWGHPLTVAARLAGDTLDEVGLRDCTGALAAADYLSRAIGSYRRDARFGRVPFAVEELLAADIDNADLAAGNPPPRLEQYLRHLRERAMRYFEIAAAALPRDRRAPLRHLLVLAALGSRHLTGRGPVRERSARDLFLAWKTARRANG